MSEVKKGDKPIGLDEYLRVATYAQHPFDMARHKSRGEKYGYDADDPEVKAVLAAVAVGKPGTDPEAPVKLAAVLLCIGVTVDTLASLIDVRCGWKVTDDALERLHRDEIVAALAIVERGIGGLRDRLRSNTLAFWEYGYEIAPAFRVTGGGENGARGAGSVPPSTAKPTSAGRPAWIVKPKPRTNKGG